MKTIVTLRTRNLSPSNWVLEGWNQRRKAWFNMDYFTTEDAAKSALEQASKSFAPRNNILASHHSIPV